MRRFAVLLILLFPLTARPASAGQGSGATVRIGSKKFTESVILAELAGQVLQSAGTAVEQKSELGGTRLVFSALQHGEIDIYPEYSGTLRMEIFKDLRLTSDAQLDRALAAQGLRMTPPLGFNDTYALGMKEDTAERLGIRTISDLSRHPELRLGLTNEFLDRGDGWPSLRAAYRLPQQNVRGLDHDVAYRALNDRAIDVTDLYSTDAEIPYYGLRTLDDDLGHFPVYDAVFLYRADLETRAPRVVAALQRLCGTLNENSMRLMNSRVQIGKESEAAVAADFLQQRFGIAPDLQPLTGVRRVLQRTREHLFLVGVSLAAGILVAIPLGILAYKSPRVGQVVLGLVGIIQTIPALALLVFMIPILGIAAPPAIAALFLYSLLPMVRNTHAGLRGIPPSIEESAEALGLPGSSRLLRIELPLAAPSILAGIKTSAVIAVGFATLGALIGAGGYGQSILTGIRLNNYHLILEGAVPSALLALVVQGLFELAEHALIPRGLRLQKVR